MEDSYSNIQNDFCANCYLQTTYSFDYCCQHIKSVARGEIKSSVPSQVITIILNILKKNVAHPCFEGDLRPVPERI